MTAIQDFYQEHGYYVARGIFAPTELPDLTADFDRIVDQLLSSGEKVNARWGGEKMAKIAPKDSFVYHTHSVERYSANWLRACQQAKFLAVAEAILGADIILHHTKLFQKPPRKGAPFAMHQDWSYFPTIHDTMMAGIVHLTDTSEEMGCFRVYPGSHKLGRRNGTNGQDGGGNHPVDKELMEKYTLDNATPLTAKAGDVVFFHYCLMHGSAPNVSDQTRKTVLIQLHAGSDAVESDNQHSNARLTLRGWNHHTTRHLAGVE